MTVCKCGHDHHGEYVCPDYPSCCDCTRNSLFVGKPHVTRMMCRRCGTDTTHLAFHQAECMSESIIMPDDEIQRRDAELAQQLINAVPR